MRVVNRVTEFREQLDRARLAGRTVGLVPTMGSLHEGHLSLVLRSAADCDVTAVTVFVNPLQFGPQEDLVDYPRHLEGDIAAARGAGADLVFAPAVEEMYPEHPATRVSVDVLSTTLEGASRPGHLAGVATVVAKLFNAAGPCRAYFGEKDFQQLLVVRRMVRDLFFPVVVVACPTVREPDGLARSSRNVRLTGADREAATVLWRALNEGAGLVQAGERDGNAVRRRLDEVMRREPRAYVDYAEVVSSGDLVPLSELSGDVRLVVAARVGTTRLIDNMGVTVSPAANSGVFSGATSGKER
jgi:pantoate--beta-alanine ligase